MNSISVKYPAEPVGGLEYIADGKGKDKRSAPAECHDGIYRPFLPRICLWGLSVIENHCLTYKYIV